MRLRLLLVLTIALSSRRDGAQTVPTVPTVHGVTYDSVARAPLAGARVQLVSADDPARFSRTAVSDSLGRYALADVPVGRYTLGFFHPLLDSIGVESPLGMVSVSGREAVRVDL